MPVTDVVSDGVVGEQEAAVDTAVHSEAEVLARSDAGNGEAVQTTGIATVHTLNGIGLLVLPVLGDAVLRHIPHAAGHSEAVAAVLRACALISGEMRMHGAVAQTERCCQLLPALCEVAVRSGDLVEALWRVVLASGIDEASEQAAPHVERVADECTRHVPSIDEAVPPQHAVRHAASTRRGQQHILFSARRLLRFDGRLSEQFPIAEQLGADALGVARLSGRRRAILRALCSDSQSVCHPHAQPPGHVLHLSARRSGTKRGVEHSAQRRQQRVVECDGLTSE